ncbi:MAG: outer membrane protein assembly factor BamD [Steroidobacteraceae bacterium]|nr:outer membrane protein assembly factor BamD [Steroidobacteraceae bacterium]
MLAVVLASATVAGCFNTRDEQMGMGSPDVLYQRASEALAGGNYEGAIRVYEALEARFPFSDGARQARLDLMYAYYRQGKKEEAVDAADTFIRENPTHPRIDYAYYVKGLVYFERDPNFLERWFDVDLTERPPQDARQSFDAFARVVTQFPRSEYAPDSRQRMIYLRNRLAEYEINVADYYLRRGAWVAAAARGRYVIENYDGAPAVRDALEIMVESYRQLGLEDLASQSASVLAANFPERARQLEDKPWWRFW